MAHRALQPPTPRFNEVLILKVGMAVVTAGMVISLACFFLLLPSVTVRLYEGNSETESELRATLVELRGAWDPRERERLLAAAPALRGRLSGTLHRMLRMHDFDLLEQGVEYAGALGEPALRPVLTELLGTERRLSHRIRPKALIAAEQLGPWSTEELATFLVERNVPVQLAALQVSSVRKDAPWGQVIELMSDPDAVLREAAVAAIPENPPATLLTELWVMVAQPDPEQYRVGLKALARVGCTPEIQTRLVAMLAQLEDPAKLVCLDMIGRCPARLQAPENVWAIATDDSLSQELRARALYCLEQTQSFRADQLLDRYPFMTPVSRYFAARCLLRQGHGEAAKLLLDLLDTEDAAARLATRRLLAWMTGRSPGSDREEFEQALQAAERTTGELPQPSYEFVAPE